MTDLLKQVTIYLIRREINIEIPLGFLLKKRSLSTKNRGLLSLLFNVKLFFNFFFLGFFSWFWSNRSHMLLCCQILFLLIVWASFFYFIFGSHVFLFYLFLFYFYKIKLILNAKNIRKNQTKGFWLLYTKFVSI
uniref:F21D18.1 n=1 Tax=Arabidopsis thaliana TaxID=3702 RepID=Q9LNH8_ARATH|nr:F21D18.1 [Arabidopsis thaliana]